MKRNEQALTLFEFDDAVRLGEAAMMSMPTMTEPAPEQHAYQAGPDGIEILEGVREHRDEWAHATPTSH